MEIWMKKSLICFFILVCKAALVALPADISFFVADLKYNERQGVKICEVQPGNFSVFKGFDFIYQEKGVVGEMLCQILSQYNRNFWFVDNAVTFSAMKEHFIAHRWRKSPTIENLYKNKKFLKLANTKIENPHDLHQYPVVVFARMIKAEDIFDFLHRFPGALLIDAAQAFILGDKFKMSCLFVGDERLENVKPKWKLYNKRYYPGLAEKIIADIGSDILVIKPTNASEGRGVLMIPKVELDRTLKLIINEKESLAAYPDRGYCFWAYDTSESFLVEEFFESDPIYPAHLDGLPYNATMRVVFVLVYHQEQVSLHYLGAYWIVPEKSITQAGSLHEKCKAYVLGTDYYCDVDLDTLHNVEEQLREPLIMMYKKMLGINL